jgi:hypothetical protein
MLGEKIASNLKVLPRMTPVENSQNYKQPKEIPNTSPGCDRYTDPLGKFGLYNVVLRTGIAHVVQGSVKKFPERWYSTLMVGHTTTLI